MVKQRNQSSLSTKNSGNARLGRSLFKFTFKGDVIQQMKTVVLRSISFQALGCKDGARISICPFKALIEYPWEALQNSYTIPAPDLAVVVY